MVANTGADRSAEQVPTALLVSSFQYDRIYFEGLFSRPNWRLFNARTTGEAFDLLGRYIIPVIVVDERIEPEGWKGVLAAAQQLAYSPKLIVVSLQTTDEIWADVLNVGGYDVLARPLEQQEVLHSLSMAWLCWRNDVEREAAIAVRRTRSGVRTPDAGSFHLPAAAH